MVRNTALECVVVGAGRKLLARLGKVPAGSRVPARRGLSCAAAASQLVRVYFTVNSSAFVVLSDSSNSLALLHLDAHS